MTRKTGPNHEKHELHEQVPYFVHFVWSVVNNGGTKTALILLIALAMLLAGCGNKPVETDGNEFVRQWDEPSSLDPHLASDVDSATIVIEVFGGLVTLDTSFNVAPDLADNWTVSPDRKTYTFNLRGDARFHSGRVVTAEDVKWSLERAADPKTQSTTVDTYLGDIVGVRAKLAGESTEISGVKVIDSRTVEIAIDAPKVYFLSKLTYPTAFVLDRENIASSPEWFKNPNGTGPFKLKEYRPGELIILERNPDYHLGPAKLERVRFILSGGSPLVMYENNEIQLTGLGLPDLELARDPKSPLNKDLRTAPPGFQTSYIGMNVKQPPFDDVKVRQALNHAINREDIVSKVLLGRVRAAQGILPPGFPGFSSDIKGLNYDPERAKKLLAESTYGADPRKLPRATLTVPGAIGTAAGPELQAVLAMWRETLGIDVSIQQVEFASFLRELHAGRLQMFVLAWVADYPDPQNFLDLLFHSKSINNEAGYSNPEVDRLLEAARTEPDQKKRFSLYTQAEQIIVTDAPWAPLWHPGDGYLLIKPEVKGYPLSPLVVPKYRFVYLEK